MKDGKVITPNLKWVVDGQKLAETLKVERVGLINDLDSASPGR